MAVRCYHILILQLNVFLIMPGFWLSIRPVLQAAEYTWGLTESCYTARLFKSKDRGLSCLMNGVWEPCFGFLPLQFGPFVKALFVG